ncbi:MAG: hydantoinase/oxoprolinase family protein, partial [Gemmatimonas sp.]
SIGWIDAGGALRAGPESAGAVPGPAAYGRGGLRPTVTDAHVVLGHIAEGTWSGGVTISAARAQEALTHLATPLQVSIARAADALIATADATMARALRRVSVERGVDPRDAVLIAFGGGGPLHACGLAERLGMRRIVIPPHAGVLSAIGLAIAPERREGVASFVTPATAIDSSLLAARLMVEAQRLGATDRDTTSARWWIRTRYEGQGYELDVPVTPGDTGGALAARFVERHVARTGFALDRGVECISLRTSVGGAPWPVSFGRPLRDGVLPDDEDDGRAMTRTLHGSCVVRLADATMHVAAGWVAQALPIGGWMMERA